MRSDISTSIHVPLWPTAAIPDVALAFIIALGLRWRVRLVAFIAFAATIGLAASHVTTGEIARDHSLGCLFAGHIFTAFHLLFLTDPLNEFRHERDLTHPAELSFPRRVYWALSIVYCPRGVGWSYEVNNVPPRPSGPKWTFVRRHLLRTFRYYLLVDVGLSYQHAHPSFNQSADPFSVSEHGYIQRCINIVARYTYPYGPIGLQYSLLAALSVGLGFTEPRSWPAIYGQWSDAYTLRRFWGRTYHQMIRRYTASIGKWVCRLLGLRQGSRISSYTQLYVGFAVSGLMHCGGDLMIDPALFGVSFLFFFSQAIAITFEDIVVGTVRRIGVKVPVLLSRLIGYAWVFLWLSISAPWFIRWAILAGAMDPVYLPFSFVAVAQRLLSVRI